MLRGREKKLESLTARNQCSILRVSHLFGSFELLHTKNVQCTMYTRQASFGLAVSNSCFVLFNVECTYVHWDFAKWRVPPYRTSNTIRANFQGDLDNFLFSVPFHTMQRGKNGGEAMRDKTTAITSATFNLYQRWASIPSVLTD